MKKKKRYTSTLEDLHDYNVDPSMNHIYIVGEEGATKDDDGGAEPGVEFQMANRLMRNLNYLIHKNGDSPIIIHMKTCGGDWSEGIAMYDLIKNCPNHITIINYTHARSMSSLMFLAADFRIMLPHSLFMFHSGSMTYSGTHKQFLTEAELAKKTEDQMLEIYVDVLRGSEKFQNSSAGEIRQWLVNRMDRKEEVYLNANEAMELNFTNAIIGENGLTIYNTADYS